MLIVPADVLRPRRPDEHFADEAAAARAAGLPVALVDHDALVAGDSARAVGRIPAGGPAVYRGWMLSAAAYQGLAEALAERGTTLRTSPDQYRRGHELPGWYDRLREFTPVSAWTRGDDRDAFDRARVQLGAGPAVLRDYTKSMKHHWYEAAYIPDTADPEQAWSVARRMRELRDDDFAGGFVLRRFEDFTGAEVRTWWVDGACRLVTAHPDTADEAPPAGFEVPALAPALAALDLPFATVDLARRRDGLWRVIEAGDGQVSDRPSSVPAEAFVGALFGPGAGPAR